ncbi:DUF459 domain-containing protein [Variovorax sp. UMC13]|uniref:SGNH/GDSL hydrolase family protein n=1 Tax=Variovorax sp. UMC13 TaxID=1862326 RepID=UPI001600CC0E|nr:DUF459 domain-containing protein [Variovorax sp. UMC13]MBB1599273.1 hypothetical protein [Variovorax sp. UMC13]
MVPTSRSSSPSMLRRVLRNDRRQLALVAAGFALVIALLESRGLIVWADRLEVGPLQQQLARGTRALDGALTPLGIAAWRPRALETLARSGWSDMPQDDGKGAPPAMVLATQAATPSPLPSPAASAPVAAATPASPPAPAVAVVPAVLPPAGPVEALPVAQALQGGTVLTPLPQATAARPRVVALAGDSVMAVGLSAQLQRDLAPYRDSIVTLKAYRSATGLARPEVFDWLNEYPLMLEHRRPDVVIVAIGANDGQGFVEGGKVKAFGTPEWHAAYAKRIADYLAMLARDGALVLWLQLPPMKSAKFNARMETINEIAREAVAREPRAIWWNPMGRIADANGEFREFGPRADGKKTVRLREADGIHLSDEGAGLITPDLVRWLNPAAPPAPAPRSGS